MRQLKKLSRQELSHLILVYVLLIPIQPKNPLNNLIVRHPKHATTKITRQDLTNKTIARNQEQIPLNLIQQANAIKSDIKH